MVPHPHDDGPVERGVRLSMPAAGEAVAGPLSSRTKPGWGRPAELGEGGFRMNPIGGVATDDQHLGGGVGTDAQALTQRRRGLGGESTQVTVVVHDLDGASDQRRASARRVCFAEAVGVSIVPQRHPRGSV